METSNDCFVAVLKKRLKEQGRGSKKKFALGVGVSPNHLSDILAGRKNAGQKLKERIAGALTMTFEDMLVLGRLIVEGRESGKNDQDFTECLNQEAQSNEDFLVIAAQILESDTPYRQALINNLTAFHQAIEMGSMEKKALQMIASLQEEINSIRQDIAGLKQIDKEKGGGANSIAA